MSSELAPCDACAAGKLANVSFPAKKARALKFGQVLIAIDYVGPMETASHDGFTGMTIINIEPFHLTAVFPVKTRARPRNCVQSGGASQPECCGA